LLLGLIYIREHNFLSKRVADIKVCCTKTEMLPMLRKEGLAEMFVGNYDFNPRMGVMKEIISVNNKRKLVLWIVVLAGVLLLMLLYPEIVLSSVQNTAQASYDEQQTMAYATEIVMLTSLIVCGYAMLAYLANGVWYHISHSRSVANFQSYSLLDMQETCENPEFFYKMFTNQELERDGNGKVGEACLFYNYITHLNSLNN